MRSTQVPKLADVAALQHVFSHFPLLKGLGNVLLLSGGITTPALRRRIRN